MRGDGSVEADVPSGETSSAHAERTSQKDGAGNGSLTSSSYATPGPVISWIVLSASALDQEAGDFRGHVVEHVEQLVIGVENLQSCVGVAGREFARRGNGDGIVIDAVKNQRGLGEIRVIFVAAGIRQELIAEAAIAILSVMEYFHRAGTSPFFHLFGAGHLA